MARALPAGRPVRRRALFGFVDADGWAWASIKAFLWLLVIIITLGYIPDRAYYFIVSRTIDLGILGWSPVNLCPPENGASMPCPVPAGAVLPWQPTAAEAALPAPRTQGVAAQIGTNLLYIGGLDGTEPTDTTYLATIENGTIGAWREGPKLPAPRANAAIAILSGTAYIVGGTGPGGDPTDTVWTIKLDPDSGELESKWTELEVTLPEARSGAAAAPGTDGVIVAGGVGPGGNPTATVWKSTLDSKGVMGKFAEQPSLPHIVTDATMALEGTFLWVYGGADEAGPTNVVQRADFGSLSTATSSSAPGGSGAPVENSGAPAASPAASGASQGVSAWATLDSANLPASRSGGAGFASNGALYLVGGTDGSGEKRELYWAIPDATGNLTSGTWFHLDATDLPEGRADAAPVVSGSSAYLLGGSVNGAATSNSVSANLAPQEPFFRLGIAGVTVPALKIGGEIGQQLGYLAAAGVGTGNFVLLVALGWAFNNRPKLMGWMERRRQAREAKAPGS